MKIKMLPILQRAPVAQKRRKLIAHRSYRK